MKSRKLRAHHQRKRDFGGGRHYKAADVRRCLYDWWVSMRYAIDWKKLATQHRSRGKKLLARIPRSLLRTKAKELFTDHAIAALLNGKRGNNQPRRTVVCQVGETVRFVDEAGNQEISDATFGAQGALGDLLGELV